MYKVNLRELVKRIPFARKFGKKLRQKVHGFQYVTYPKLAPFLHERALKKVKRQETPVKVVFMVIHESVWKLDRLYWLMEASKEFKPIVLICPYVMQGEEVKRRDMKKAFDWFEKRGYNVKSSIVNGRLLNIKAEMKPDLVFFTNPHDLTETQFLAKSFVNVLTAYVPYGHQVTKYMNYYAQYNQLSHNTMWKIFTINQLDKNISTEYANNKGRNVEITGYAGIDKLIDTSYTAKNVWKPQIVRKRKIIWAPHHTIEIDSPLKYSTFLDTADYMKSLSTDYSDVLQFSFKPHPLLKDKLYAHEEWGLERTNEFFNFWDTSVNTQLDLADYIDLFLTSDAIIHDSGSFLAEYLYVNKPALFMIADDSIEERFSPLGTDAFNACSHGRSCEDIRRFIESEVLENKDSKKDIRESFVESCLPSNGAIPSDLIFTYLLKQLKPNSV
ncbi:CDP-glycerol glycerophosphotransferase family protein [Glaciecola sp. MF2-115]|uniref:CDP-glycerol glycerophosphotransferase family protein n=1 Tax=Glaciecola sp. MF2-115 TaxID=3384827 RepID=UPI0039A07582